MATIAEQLIQLQNDKQVLVDNLVAKGVEASSDETFTTLAPKVANIETGGGEDEYWNLTPKTSGSIASYLKTIPLIDTSSYTTASSMFSGFENLITIPAINTTNVTSTDSMFQRCVSLEEVPLFDTSNVTNMNSMFRNCPKLKSIPQFNTSNVTYMSGTFQDCHSIETIPELDASKVTKIGSNTFYQNRVLTNFGGLRNLGMAYLSTVSADYSDYRVSLSVSVNLTHDSLMNVINNLYDIASIGVKTQTLQLGSTNKPKLTADEIAVATNKGWTVS